MDPKEYKTFHENYMMDNTGTSVEECGILLSTVPFCLFISSWISPYFPKAFIPVLEFCIIILPVIFNTTILSDVNHIVVLNLMLLVSTISMFKLDFNIVSDLLNSKIQGKKSFITSYRACTNFFSALCILAVDFTVFPKRLAKTESFGFGFMDLGVGFYVCANGLVEKHSPTKNQFVKLMKSVFVLLILGGIRLVSVKSLDYHEHVSEYGVHWNFFFTLASCRLFSYLIMTITNYANPFSLALATGLIHETLLVGGLQEWVLSDVPRNSFLSANREGLTSCLGYVCLYFTASSIGKLINYSNNLTYKILLQRLVILNLISYTSMLIFLNTTGVSRRLVNLGYIFWVLFLTLTEILLFAIIDIVFWGIKKEKKQLQSSLATPVLTECINTNGLFYFLFCNVLTGLVNSLFQTLLLGKTLSMVIITAYMAVLYSVNYFLYIKNINLKL